MPLGSNASALHWLSDARAALVGLLAMVGGLLTLGERGLSERWFLPA